MSGVWQLWPTWAAPHRLECLIRPAPCELNFSICPLYQVKFDDHLGIQFFHFIHSFSSALNLGGPLDHALSLFPCMNLLKKYGQAQECLVRQELSFVCSQDFPNPQALISWLRPLSREVARRLTLGNSPPAHQVLYDLQGVQEHSVQHVPDTESACRPPYLPALHSCLSIDAHRTRRAGFEQAA